jgi:hypothetical protein
VGRNIPLILLYLGISLLSFVANVPELFRDKDIAEIRKRLLWKAIMYATGLVVFTLLLVFISVKTAFVVVSLIVLLIILNFVVFRKRIQNSTSFLHYLVDDKPGLFYKDKYGHNYLKSFFVVALLIAICVGIIAFAIWGSIPVVGN